MSLKDADSECSSALQLCERVAALKETAKYKNASEGVKNSSGKDGEREQLRHVIVVYIVEKWGHQVTYKVGQMKHTGV